MPASTEELKRTLSYLLTVKKSFLHKLQLQYLSDGDKKGISAFKILRSLIRGCKFEQVKPVLATFIKRHGFAEPRVGKILVHYLCMKNNVSGALSVLRKLKENNLSVTFPVDVLVLFMNQGRILDAYDLVLGAQDNLHVLDVVDYSIVIDGLCKEGYIDRALILSELARKKGVELNVVIYNAVLHGLCRQRCLIEAFRLFDSMERNEVVPSDFTYGTLIDALVREGFLLDARQLFERMIVKGMEPNTHIYNSLISGCCQFNNLEEALNLFDELGMRSLKPDEFTISSLIDGFCRMGDLEGALQFFVNVKTEGIVPDFLGFVYLVRGLCAKGRMEEARNILREMLQSRSSVEMINKVDVQIETDSVESFLVQLCERGSIQDALVILNEIASMFFPYKRERASSEPRQFPSLEDDMARASSKPLSFVHQLDSQDSEKVEEGEDNCCDLRYGCHQSSFNAFYSRVASLCATGDVQGASKLTREIILSCG